MSDLDFRIYSSLFYPISLYFADASLRALGFYRAMRKRNLCMLSHSARPSVRLTVTFMYFIQTAELKISSNLFLSR